MSLSYKQLQSALRTLKSNGLTSIKLNSKQEVLQEEYNRLTAVKEQEQCDTSNGNSSYPFCENTVKVENNTPQVFNSANSYVLPAMNSSRAPSWLCKPVTIYVIDGMDFLSHELEAQLQGQVCELPAAANERKIQSNQPPRLQEPARKDVVSKARPAVPIINTAKDRPKVAVTFKAQEDYSPYFIDTTKAARYSKGLGETELQAARNAEDIVRSTTSATKRVVGAVIDLAKGFHKAQVERTRKAAA